MRLCVVVVAAVIAAVLLAIAYDPRACIGIAKQAVHGPRPEPISARLEITSAGGVSIDGEEVRGPVATKTQVLDGAGHVSGTISVSNQDAGFIGEAPTEFVGLIAGPLQLRIDDITQTGWDGPSPAPSPPAGTTATFAVFLCFSGQVDAVDHEFVYFSDSGPWTIERDFDITVTGQRLNRTLATSPGTGRESSPVYAKECAITDAWEDLPEADEAAEVTFGSLSHTMTGPDPYLAALNSITWNWKQRRGNAGVVYARVSLEWEEVPVNFDGMGYTSGNFRLTGDGNSVYLDVPSTGSVGVEHGVGIYRPYLADFSPFAVVDRDGELVGDLLVDGGFKADKRYAWTLGLPKVGSGVSTAWGDSILLTVDQIRGIGKYSTPPGVTGLSYTDSDYSHVLHSGASLSFTMDEDSAVAHGHDSGDLEILLRVPGVDQTTCDLDAEVDFDALLFSFNANTGIYGPEPALDNTDWTGADGAATPNLAGQFAVTNAAGNLTLTIPSNYGDLCDDIPNQNFPTGMPGCPTLTFAHKADAWRDYDGELGQDSNPYSIPAEGVYCWRGFACLKIPITAPGACTLTVQLQCKRHSHTDNHLSDSSRQTQYEHAETDQTNTYTVNLVAGANNAYVYLQLAQERTNPDLEQVVSVKLSGFAVGDWIIDEPLLTADPIASQSRVKVFEGPEYRHGGFSAINSPDHVYSLMDTTEQNNGHANLQEWTVRLFDYVVGATSGKDLTTAFSLASMAGILHNVCDAWECSVNQDALDAATLDEDSNRLTSCWSFNVCHPDCVTVGLANRTHRPLLQDVSGSLNCSLRCRTWSRATGIVYAVRTDAVIGGAVQGLSRDGYTLVRDQQDALKVWRRKSGEDWATYQTGIDVDAFGMFHTWDLQEFDPADGERWEYGISPAGAEGPTALLGNAYLREYIALAVTSAQGHPQDIAQDEHDRTWCVLFDSDGVVQCQGADMGRRQPIWEDAEPPFGSATDYERPRVACGPRGRIVVAATDGTQQMAIAVSDDMGGSWSAISGSVLTGLQYGDIAIGEHDELAVCGWQNDKIRFRLTTQADHSADLLTGVSTELEVCDAVVSPGGDPPWSVVERVTRGVWAVLVEGIGLYIVQAYADGFAQVTGTHLADGLTYADIAVGEHDELGCAGYDAAADAVVFRATTAADWTADPLSGTDTELTVCDASGASEGPYVSLAGIVRGAWLVGVDDGNGAQKFYRLRSAATGFEEIAT